MRNTIKAAAVIALSLFAAACAKETKIESPAEGQKLHFTINTAENAVVKSFIESNPDGTYAPQWSKDDKLAIFVGAIGENTKPTGVLSNVNEKGTLAKFDGIVTGIEGSGTFKSFTPASAFAISYNSGNVGITLSESQKPSSLTIDEACDILVAKEANYTADADSKVTVNDLFFKRMFSVVKVALKGSATLNGEKVQKFSLTAPEGTVLTGRAAIDLSTATIEGWNVKNNAVTATYEADAPVFGGVAGLENVVWLVVNPCTVASGAKVVFAGETAGYTFSKEVTLSKDLMFPESQLAVINLTLADENCTKKATPAAASWIATDLADIAATDEVVITMAKGESVYALTSAKGTTGAPTAVAVTVKNKELTAAPADDLVWNIVNDNENLTIYPKGQTAIWLYTTNDNNGVRVGKSNNKTFIVDSKYLKNATTNRYLGVYNGQDWRCYTSTTTNIGGQTLCFYVKGDPIDNTIPTLSVDQTSKTWAADATDAFVVKVTVNSEGGDWTVTPETLSWATVAVDKTAGTITVTPNGANTAETANEAILTVAHASDASLTKEITLKQNAAGGDETPKTYTLTFANTYGDETVGGYTTTWNATRDGFTWKLVNWNNNRYNNGWTYVKAGPKGNTKAHAMIETAAMPEAISKISITIDKVENGSITSIVLKSSTTDDFTSGTTIETKTSVQQGEVVFSIPSPQNGLFYQLDFTLNNTTSNDKKGKNGVAQVSKVVYTNN